MLTAMISDRQIATLGAAPALNPSPHADLDLRGVECEVFETSDSSHLSQVYTGLAMLAQRRQIRLRIRKAPRSRDDPTAAPHLRDAWRARLEVVVARRVRVCFDVHDSWEVDTALLRRVNYYFKRSYSSRELAAVGVLAPTLLPLGLNYPVVSDRFDLELARRAIRYQPTLRSKLAHAAAAVPWLDRWAFAPRVGRIEAEPNRRLALSVLFVARAWDPAEIANYPREMVEQRLCLNEQRASCMRALRQRFGAQFYGGLIADSYSRRAYPDVAGTPGVSTHRGRYLAFARSVPICVASNGLHGSTGWKFAEYLAMARAIVSEPLNYELPGALAAGTHYLAFRTPEQCVAAVELLMRDEERRYAMMCSNAEYYRRYVRPDALVRNALAAALGAVA